MARTNIAKADKSGIDALNLEMRASVTLGVATAQRVFVGMAAQRF